MSETPPSRPRPTPIHGVVAVVANPMPRWDLLQALKPLKERGLSGVELRADLFADPAEALDCLGWDLGLPCVFTVRNTIQGGKFGNPETERIALYREALRRGAAAIDVEWGTEAARELSRDGVAVVLSYHDFERTPPRGDLDRLTEQMAALRPIAMKIVPTAHGLADVRTILDWVAVDDGPARIGFAMGPAGFPSRALALARGSVLSYASLGPPVAPGQVGGLEFLEIYRPGVHTRSTRVLGVVGNPVGHSLSPHLHNPALAAHGIDAVYVPFHVEKFDEILEAIDPLGIDGLSITIPFKEDALRAADQADERCRAAGAANTLRVERDASGKRKRLVAFNTDIEGVLDPLRRRMGDLRGVEAAVIGNGGAARGAVRALLEAGASPTLYFRNQDRGGPVAASLHVPGKRLSELDRGRHKIVINATPLGLKPGDPSPVEAAVFGPGTIAFDMVYGPEDTPFLAGARTAGAVTIPGREMLVSQAVEQFQIFTGRRPSYQELDASFHRGIAIRRGKPDAPL